FASRRRHTRSKRDWSSDVCSSDLVRMQGTDRAINWGYSLYEFEVYQPVTASGMIKRIEQLQRRDGIISDQAARRLTMHMTAVSRSEERRVGKERRYVGRRCSGETK